MSDVPTKPTQAFDENGVLRYRLDQADKEIERLKGQVDYLMKEMHENKLQRAKDIALARDYLLETINEMKENDIGEINIKLATLESRMTIFQGAQAVFTTIAGTVAVFLGRLP